MEQKNKRIGFAMCGSFCTFSRCFETLEELLKLGYEVVPIASFHAYSSTPALEQRRSICAVSRRSADAG